jgi:hypothetical protein
MFDSYKKKHFQTNQSVDDPGNALVFLAAGCSHPEDSVETCE